MSIAEGYGSTAGLQDQVRGLQARIAEIEAEVSRYHETCRELQMLSWKWMYAHDCLNAGKSYDLPSTVDVPDCIKEQDRLRARLDAMPHTLECRSRGPFLGSPTDEQRVAECDCPKSDDWTP